MVLTGRELQNPEDIVARFLIIELVVGKMQNNSMLVVLPEAGWSG
jgi:hypothetical protein